MKLLKNIILGFILIIVVLVAAKNYWIKSVVAAGASQVTGAPVHIDSLVIGILKPAVRIKGFTLYNPPGFPEGPMVSINELSVDYDLPAILKGNLHLPLLIVHLNEAVIIKNKDGKLNVDALKFAQKQVEQPTKEQPAKKEAPKGESKPLVMQIDLMKLDLGKVVFKDYTKGEQPVVTAFDAGVHGKTYKNIKSAQQFATIIMMESLGPTAIKSAALYGAATVLGVAFLPAGIAGVMIGKDSGNQVFNADLTKVYQAALTAVQKRGKVEKEAQDKGLIKAAIDGASVVVEMKDLGQGKVSVTVSARKMMIPKPEIAEGILYGIAEVLK